MIRPPSPLPPATDLLEYFKWTRIERRNQLLKPRGSVTLLERTVAGFLAFVILDTNSPDTTVVVDLYGDGSVDIALSPRRLYELGLTSWNSAGGYVALYDTIKNRYVAVYSPSPWIPFNGFARVKVHNPSMEEATYSIAVWLLEQKR